MRFFAVVQEIEELSFATTPGFTLPKKQFAAIVTGKVKIVGDGEYKFCVKSSDGSKV
jgi:hypothetical protein